LVELQKLLDELDPRFLERMERLETGILDQKFSATMIAPFVNSRMLNYWVEEAELLKKWKEKGWRKFSFLEIVWLKIISDLRELGVSFEILKKLKDHLFKVPTRNEMIEAFEAKRKDIRVLLSKGTLSGDVKYIHEIAAQLKDVARQMGDIELQPVLANMIAIIVIHRISASLIINKEGQCMVLLDTFREVAVMTEDAVSLLEGPHISIPLTNIIESFMLKDEIDKKLQKDFFSEDEWKILDILRYEKPASLTVKFDSKRKINLVEITRSKKVDLAHRLSNIILKEGYETIVLKTQKGKIVSCSQTEKLKL
jgi:DNA-binding transcriptional MerR regulator